jgi:hypothetical protein
MAAMRISSVTAACALLFAVGCGGRPPAAPSSATPTESSVNTGQASSGTSTTSPTASIDVPPDAPRTFGEDVDPSDLPLPELLPSGATPGASWAGSVSSGADATAQVLVVSWSRGTTPAAEVGLEIWERSDGPGAEAWRVAFAFTDPAGAGVLGVRFDVGDLTGDGSPDVLSFEDIGGSGACGTWRVIETSVGGYAGRYRRQTCDTEVRIVGGDLQVRTAVFSPDDAHCCPSAYRTTTLAWNGSSWDVVERTTEPA